MYEQGEISTYKLLEGFIDDELLSTYTWLLAKGTCTEEEAAPHVRASGSVKDLIRHGLAHRESNGECSPTLIVPKPPDLALQGVLSRILQQAASEQSRLLIGHHRLTEFGEKIRAMSEPANPRERLIRVITDHDEVRQLSVMLNGTVRHELLVLKDHALEPPGGSSIKGLPAPNLDRSVRFFAIYEAKYAEKPASSQKLDAVIGAGGEVRLLPQVRMRMKVVDGTTALVRLTQARTSSALVVQSQVIVTALREYFELLWERAIPFGDAADTCLSPVQAQVLRLLALGLPDEAIARQLEVSVNTVRRHYTAIREKLHVETRFAAGAAAVRQGWVS